MLRQLSRLMRAGFVFEEQEHVVPFEEERKVAEAYLEIEQIRFGDQLKLDWRVDDVEFLLPPYILLPLLENAIMHGLRERDQLGIIRLTVRAETDGVTISIEDNGPGFTDEQIRCWQDHNYMQFPIDGTGIGLQNVQMRLKRHMKCGLVLGRSEWGGAKVMVTLPKLSDGVSAVSARAEEEET
jgi:two-component system sensor histidine kinase ChiS